MEDPRRCAATFVMGTAIGPIRDLRGFFTLRLRAYGFALFFVPCLRNQNIAVRHGWGRYGQR
jgi:hypothetical protein